MKTPVVLTILDGFGLRENSSGNAIEMAKTPILDKIFAESPYTTLGASGMDVGLPDGQMGNSEVGHTNMGAGRIVYQNLTRITKSISDGDFFENPALCSAVDNAKKNGKALHIMGLLSDGGVHSSTSHLYAILKLAKDAGLKDVYVHAFLDGRDVPPSSGVEFVKELEGKIGEIGVGKIATITGRFYALDRDNIWERVEKAYRNMTLPNTSCEICEMSPVEATEKSYNTVDENGKNLTDEFMKPVRFGGISPVSDGDSVIFFNFRPDRARQITRAFVDEKFDGFEREIVKNLTFVCMTTYDATMPNVSVAYGPEDLGDTLGEVLAKNGKTQLRIAETQKYAHVTFFFNGGREEQFEGESRVLIPSPKVATFDLKPEMSAVEVTDAVVDEIKSQKYDVIILNYANPDMVGHTGIVPAVVTSLECVDECVGRVQAATESISGVMVVTADHGNAEQMTEPDGSPFTAHTTNPVPFAVCGFKCKLRENGILADIAPTILDILKIEKPDVMTGESMIVG